ncbi:hypothetical protein CCR94_08050 [Rhodoblastus sphagnicola]|uniref:Uncharacterized protein n=1 Tax=Rhodoblastus sphagnicola TaxID=333368 RepID=A0A2S6NAY6_9HYPH|nr:hypothetical protein [Rhodoblastus sphagnicola]MBB4199021.1 hypothetical protein [Rhodoblastus sphagnicola]PPQ31778.1 hypothetical protein CCR94_08050 [Rhodoblastus sphagnicola]
MTTIYNLRASTNVSFRWTRDLSSLSGVYDVAASIIRMQARVSAGSADPPVYEWCSSNAQGGLASFNAATGLCIFSASETDMEQMPARLVYDCRLELTSGAIIPLFAGRLVFALGVTRTASTSNADGTSVLTDTVTVDGEADNAPAPLPLALSAVLAIAQNAETAAQAAAAAATQAAAQASSASNSIIPVLIYG